MTFLHITLVVIAVLDGWGCLSKMELSGGSVARARAANVSMIKLTHSI